MTIAGIPIEFILFALDAFRRRAFSQSNLVCRLDRHGSYYSVQVGLY